MDSGTAVRSRQQLAEIGQTAREKSAEAFADAATSIAFARMKDWIETPGKLNPSSLNPWNVPGASLHAELANFVAAGMTPYQALRCATAEVGRFLGDGSGTLAVGKRADLILTSSNCLM